MKVSEVMTKDVVTVSTRTPLKDVARLLIERRISGVPVVDDDGSVLGVVSEGDILAQGARAGANHRSVLDHLLKVDGCRFHKVRRAATPPTR